MKSSLLVLAFFVTGIVGAALALFPPFLLQTDLSLYALYLLLFLVGIGIGGNTQAWQILRQVNFKIILIPLAIIVGTLGGVALFSLLVPGISLEDSLAVGAGFGYYSLSSILISQVRGETLGVVALLANIIREITTLLLAPFLARYVGKLAPIAAGGATAMDTTLPIITYASGKEYAIIAVFSGIFLTVIVPFLVTLILQW